MQNHHGRISSLCTLVLSSCRTPATTTDCRPRTSLVSPNIMSATNQIKSNQTESIDKSRVKDRMPTIENPNPLQSCRRSACRNKSHDTKRGRTLTTMADDNDLNAMDCNTANGQNDREKDGDHQNMATNNEANESQDRNTDSDDAPLTVHQYCRDMSRQASVAKTLRVRVIYDQDENEFVSRMFTQRAERPWTSVHAEFQRTISDEASPNAAINHGNRILSHIGSVLADNSPLLEGASIVLDQWPRTERGIVGVCNGIAKSTHMSKA